MFLYLWSNAHRLRKATFELHFRNKPYGLLLASYSRKGIHGHGCGALVYPASLAYTVEQRGRVSHFGVFYETQVFVLLSAIWASKSLSMP